MKKILIMMLLSFSVMSAEVSNSLSCSKKLHGTQLFFINGIRNKDTDALKTAKLINTRLGFNSNKKRLDENENVFVELLYNNTEGPLLDSIQTINQKIAETGQLPSPKLIASFIFTTTRFCLPNPLLCTIIGAELSSQLLQQSYFSMIDLQLMTDSIESHLKSDYKVIVISHSQGNLYANMVHDELLRRGMSKDTLSKYYGNLQIGTIASSVKAKNSRIYLAKEDGVANEIRLKFPSTLKANYSFTSSHDSMDVYKHRMSESYLSPLVDIKGPQQGKGITIRKANEVFIQNLEEIAWMLANNDENCCEGRDGRFYRKDYDTDPEKGFLEKTVSVDKNLNFEADKDSQVCGNVALRSSDPNFKIKLEKTIIAATGSAEIKGNLFLVDTVINPFEKDMTIKIDGTKSKPIYMENSIVTGKLNISGAMILKHANLSGKGSVKGELFNRSSSGTNNWYVPTILHANISGDTNIEGVYNIERDLNDTTIKGRAVNSPNGGMNFTNIAPHAFHINKGNISGLMYLVGRVDYNVTINGVELVSGSKSDYSGIHLTSSSEIHANANVKGTAYINGSKFSGTLNGNSFDPQGTFMHLSGSNVFSSNISGAPYIAGSSHTRSTISGYPVISGGSYLNSNFSCNAKVYGESVTGKSFGCGYITELRKQEDLNPIDDYNEATVEWENWVTDKQEEIRAKF